MFEESGSQMPSSSASTWESMASWFTPTVLFLLLNLMIATIAFTSSLANSTTQKRRNREVDDEDDRSPPSLLQRIKFISFQHAAQQHKQNPSPDSEDTLFDGIESHTHYFFQHSAQENLEIHTQIQPQYPIDSPPHPDLKENHVSDADFDGFHPSPPRDVAPDQYNGSIDEVFGQLTTTNHFTRSISETEPAKPEIPARKMMKSASARYREEAADDAVEARRPLTVREKRNSRSTEGDEGVDAKADVFINKFKHQLKLQRLDSIIRSKDGR